MCFVGFPNLWLLRNRQGTGGDRLSRQHLSGDTISTPLATRCLCGSLAYSNTVDSLAILPFKKAFSPVKAKCAVHNSLMTSLTEHLLCAWDHAKHSTLISWLSYPPREVLAPSWRHWGWKEGPTASRWQGQERPRWDSKPMCLVIVLHSPLSEESCVLPMSPHGPSGPVHPSSHCTAPGLVWWHEILIMLACGDSCLVAWGAYVRAHTHP